MAASALSLRVLRFSLTQVVADPRPKALETCATENKFTISFHQRDASLRISKSPKTFQATKRDEKCSKVADKAKDSENYGLDVLFCVLALETPPRFNR